jgi:hypothetical protein
MDSADSAMEKLNKLFGTLDPGEREVVSEMVRVALIAEAERYGGTEVSGYSLPKFVTALTGKTAPALVSSLRFPGSLAAHSIPSCASSGLTAIKEFNQGGAVP